MWKPTGYSPVIVLSWSEGYYLPKGHFEIPDMKQSLIVSTFCSFHTSRVHWAALHLHSPHSAYPMILTLVLLETQVPLMSIISEDLLKQDLMCGHFLMTISLTLMLPYIAVWTWLLLLTSRQKTNKQTNKQQQQQNPYHFIKLGSWPYIPLKWPH